MTVTTRTKVIELKKQGMRQNDIARKLGISAPLVSYHIQRAKQLSLFDERENDHRQLRDRIVELAEDIPMIKAIHIVAQESGLTYGWLARLINGCSMLLTNHPNWDSWSDTALLTGFHHNRTILEYHKEKVEERETIDYMMRQQLRKRGLHATNNRLPS